MTRDYLRTLVDFNYWALGRVLAAAETLPAELYGKPLNSSFSSVRDTLIHIYQAEWVWCERLQGNSPSARPEVHAPDVGALRGLWAPLEGRLRAYAAALDEAGLSRVLEYRFLDGTARAATLWQIFAHVVNHETYHRGQVTTMLRQLGAAPPASTDMIQYFRETAP